MRQIPITYGLLFFLDEIEYSEAGLVADPDAAHLAGPFRDAIDEWEGMFKKERAARREVTRADAVVAVRNEQLDLLTKRVVDMIRAFAGDLIAKLFGKVSPGQFIRRGLRQQCEKTKNTIVPALAKLEDTSPLKPFAPELDDKAKDALHALDKRSKVKGDRQLVTNEVDEWKEGINALRTTTYAELLKIATAKKYPKSWIESFFRSASSRDEGSAEEEAAPEPEGA